MNSRTGEVFQRGVDMRAVFLRGAFPHSHAALTIEIIARGGTRVHRDPPFRARTASPRRYPVVAATWRAGLVQDGEEDGSRRANRTAGHQIRDVASEGRRGGGDRLRGARNDGRTTCIALMESSSRRSSPVCLHRVSAQLS